MRACVCVRVRACVCDSHTYVYICTFVCVRVCEKVHLSNVLYSVKSWWGKILAKWMLFVNIYLAKFFDAVVNKNLSCYISAWCC